MRNVVLNHISSIGCCNPFVNVNINVNQKFFSVAKIAELLRSPQRRSRVTVQNQEMIVEKEMFLGVEGKQICPKQLGKLIQCSTRQR